MNRLLFLTISLIYSLIAAAQSDMYVVKGFTYAGNEVLSDVNITVKITSGETAQTTSHKDGSYVLTYSAVASDSITVSYSKLGFVSCSRSWPTQKELEANIQLEKDPNYLNEVTVVAESRILKGEKVTYLPNKKQVGSSNSGIGLLYSLMIPQLQVNRISDEVKSADNTPLQICINGRASNSKEVSQLRPKDILRVDFYDHPIDEFPNAQKIVNVILRKYESGGYVDLYTDTRFFNQSGSYRLQGALDTRKTTFTWMTGTYYGKDKNTSAEQERFFNLEHPFTQTTEAGNGNSKNMGYYGLLSAERSGKKTNLYAQVSLNWSRMPYNNMNMNVGYSPAYYSASLMSSVSDSKAFTPSFYGYIRTQFDDYRSLRVQLSYSVTSNRQNRVYSESNTVIRNNNKETAQDGEIEISYGQNLKHNNRLNLFLWGIYSSSDAEYRGTNVIDQSINSYGLQLLPSYRHTLWDKLSLYVQPGIYLDIYKIKGQKTYTKLFPRPRLSATYTLNDVSNVHLSVSEGTNEPSMSLFNNAVQTINRFEQVRGNPNLDIMKLWYGLAVYNLYVKNFSLSAYFNYTGGYDMTKTSYFVEGDKFIHMPVSDGKHHEMTWGVGTEWTPFGDVFQIQANLNYNRACASGLYSANKNYLTLDLSSGVYLGDFSFSAYFSTPKNVLTVMTTQINYRKTRADYGLTASWHLKSFYVEAGMRRLFDSHPNVHSWFDFGNYRFDTRSHSDSAGRQVYVKLSYGFDFGRKIKHQEMDMDMETQSGLLQAK